MSARHCGTNSSSSARLGLGGLRVRRALILVGCVGFNGLGVVGLLLVGDAIVGIIGFVVASIDVGVTVNELPPWSN